MAKFKDWLESTARSRAKTAAALCLGPKLPGTQAHSHRTDPIAAQSVGKNGEIGDKCMGGKPKGKKNKQPDWDIPESGQTPDYSFDSFVKKADEEKGKIAASIQSAREKEVELDKEAEKAEKDSGPSHEDEDGGKEDIWNALRNISKERDEKSPKKKDEPKDSKKDAKASEKKPSSSQDS